MSPVKILTAGVFLASQTLFGTAFAASVTLSGTTVDYTFDDALLGLFGPASVSGNTLYFTPVTFSAQSLNGAGFALANATLNIEVTAHANWSFNAIDLTEKGSYMLLGAGSSADVGGQMRVFDVAQPLADLTSSILPTTALDQTGLSTNNWVAGASADLSAWNSAQTVNVTVQNLLLASTGISPSLALVEKHFVGLTAVTAPIPEAETYAMMLAGLGLVGFAVARRRAA